MGDSVTYTFEICNVGEGVVTRGTVTDTLLGNLTEFFPADLDAGRVCRGCADAYGGSR